MIIDIPQNRADELIGSEKEFSRCDIIFPYCGAYLSEIVYSIDKTNKFILTVSRKGLIDIQKCSYQTRYDSGPIPLVRVDIDGSARTHTNPDPDGRVIRGPHIHIYREGYGLGFAEPLSVIFPDINLRKIDLIEILCVFCDYCHIRRNYTITPAIEGG